MTVLVKLIRSVLHLAFPYHQMLQTLLSALQLPLFASMTPTVWLSLVQPVTVGCQCILTSTAWLTIKPPTRFLTIPDSSLESSQSSHWIYYTEYILKVVNLLEISNSITGCSHKTLLLCYRCSPYSRFGADNLHCRWGGWLPASVHCSSFWRCEWKRDHIRLLN